MIKKTKKYQKPIDTDIHFKYRCPNDDCGYDHWLSISEAQTKNFKIVCDSCNYIFYPKRIKKIKILYKNITINSTKENKQIPNSLLQKATQVLIQYGFTKEESEKLLIISYNKNITDDCSTLVKNTLKFIGSTNV